MPRVIHASGVDLEGLAYLIVVLAVMFAPVLFARRPAPPAEENPDDGGGGPPRPSPDSPKPLRGGPPLPDADQSRIRLRDHRRETLGARARRRSLPGRHRRTPSRAG